MVLSKGISEPGRTSPILTIKGISRDGVVLITPSDPDFKLELSSLLKGKDSRAKALIDAAMPFCVFVKNTNNEDIVGCSLQWDIVRADGTTTTRGTSHSSPGSLTGLRAADPAMVGRTSLVNAKSTRFFSLDPDAKLFIDALTRSFGARPPLSPEQEQEAVNHIQYLRAMRKELIQPGDSITVSIDGLILSDGTFSGPDKNQLILSTKALIEAQRDISEIIDRQVKQNGDSDKVFEVIDSLSTDPRSLRKFDAQEARFEHFYWKLLRISIDELIGIRDARGSAAAIKYSQDAYHRRWPSLHPKLNN
ncbi:MAG TPA: hypothetical protein VGJ69_02465 [Pyrinomonadaceae bacterium]|jgi:hypothetical protein